jgi:imidazoleglycerol phosphate dehydratase HisB
MATMSRRIDTNRSTNETAIALSLELDGSGRAQVTTGIGFFDHMLLSLAKHANFDLELNCKGDLHVDDHHSVEDCAIVLGDALNQALGQRQGIARFGSAYAPLDEALARSVIDLSGRPWPAVTLGLQRERIGNMACENITHFFQTFAMSARCALHIDVLKGNNDHHRSEAAFKAFALSLRTAIKVTGTTIPSTKGIL